jgi:hypothetical protein
MSRPRAARVIFWRHTFASRLVADVRALAQPSAVHGVQSRAAPDNLY